MKKILAIVLMWLMPVGLVFSVYLHTHYADTRTQQADPNTGRIFPLNVHGTVVYLTRAEDFAATWIFHGGIFCAIIGGALWRNTQKH